jgi:hypothetical protein
MSEFNDQSFPLAVAKRCFLVTNMAEWPAGSRQKRHANVWLH